MATNNLNSGSGTAVEYRPMMSEERVEELHDLHRILTAPADDAESEETVSFNGLTLRVPQQVMTPCPVSHLLGKVIAAEVNEGDRVLDMGAGSGSLGLLTAGKASSLLSVDINPYAVEAVRDNAVLNGLAHRVEARRSNVFDNVDGVFDLIIFNPPFQWFPAAGVVESASTDENYAALTRFFHQVREYLAENGRIVIFFSTMGDVDYVQKLITEGGFRKEVVFQHTRPVVDLQVDFAAYRLS